MMQNVRMSNCLLAKFKIPYVYEHLFYTFGLSVMKFEVFYVKAAEVLVPSHAIN